MRQPGPLTPAALAAGAVGAGLFTAAAVAGPMLAAGGVLAVGLAAVIYLLPVAGLAFMLVSGTALQVLGSEHIIGLPLSLNKIAAAMTLGIWGLRSILQRIPLTWSPQMPAVLGFVLAVAVAGLGSPDPAESMEGLTRYIQVALLMVLIANIAGESEQALDLSCLALTASMSASALLGLMEFLLPALAIEYDDPSLLQGNIGAVIDRDSLDGVEIKRVTGGLGDSNWFGYTLVCVLPVNLYLFHRHAGTWARLLILGASGLQSVGIVLSFTRSAIIAAGVSILWLVLRGRLPLKPLLLAGMVGVAGFAAWNPAGLGRIYSTSYAQEGSTPIRAYMLRGGWSLIQYSPVLGYGYSQYGPNFHAWLTRQPEVPPYVEAWERDLEARVATGDDRFEWINAHNTYVQLWVEFGLPGMLAFTALYGFMLLDLRLAGRTGDPRWQLLADCLVASAIGFLVCCLFGSLLLIKVAWIVTGFAAALRRVALACAEGMRP
jgi:hypothetical protein